MPRSEFDKMISELDVRKKLRVLEPQLPLANLPKNVSTSVVTDAAYPVPECTICGVCCNYYMIVPVSPSESEVLDECVEVILDGVEPAAAIDRALLRDAETGNCRNLDGTLGSLVGCTIYENRPHVCRDFDAGSDRCRELRRMYGLERQLTKDEVDTAMERLGECRATSTIKDVAIIADSRVSEVTMSSEGAERYESTMLKMVALLDEETTVVLHRYDAKKEIWFESELIGFTLDEAREMIRSRTVLQF
jgi:Fe-S-cluster containining protein